MITRLLAAVAALLLAGCGEAEPDLPPPSPAMWQITAPSGETGWLFGTVHVLPDGVTWRTPALEDALDQSAALVVEIANPGDPATAELFTQLSHTPGQAPLLQRVAPEDRDELEALVARTNVQEAQFAAVESWGVALMLAGAVGAGDPANGVDKALLAEGKPVLALETAREQLALFDTLPQADQSALLAATAHEAAGDQGQAITAWLTGDLAQLERLGETGLLAHPALRESLLDARNRAWAARIDGIVTAGQRPFVAVGAAHMLGAGGLPALLAARGYTVRRAQ